MQTPLRRLAYRVGYHVLRAWWFVRRPRHRGAKCVITRGDEVLLVRHTYGPSEQWDLPGGGVKRRERPREAARREAREELGVDLDEWRSLGDLFERIDFKRDTLCCFHADVREIRVERDEAEIAEVAWFPRDRLPTRIGRYVPRIIGLAR
jgi:8-oxo-dGTP pyrophosphatase MutT (NUDIX family)